MNPTLCKYKDICWRIFSIVELFANVKCFLFLYYLIIEAISKCDVEFPELYLILKQKNDWNVIILLLLVAFCFKYIWPNYCSKFDLTHNVLVKEKKS